MNKALILAIALAFYGVNTQASSDAETPFEESNTALSVREIQAGDVETLGAIMAACYPHGLPATAQGYTDRMMTRQTTGNLFTCYLFDGTLEEDATQTLAAVGFGRMPVTGYKAEEHEAIINQFITLGVLQKRDPGGGLEESNLERVGNYGLGVILPMLPLDLSGPVKITILQGAISHFSALKTYGNTLPDENTVPKQLMGLFHPEDPILPLMRQAGFTVTENEGFFNFYNKPRVMAHLAL